MGIIGIIGLGYVGTPLAMLFCKHLPVIGFDIDAERIAALKLGNDPTRNLDQLFIKEVQVPNLDYFNKQESGLFLTNDTISLKAAQTLIITVPTPDNEANCLDLSMLEQACTLVGSILQKNALVIIESTVYPGVTEEICIPILEATSGLRCNIDFEVGYSPERVNPGDAIHTLDKIVKLVAGSNSAALEKVATLYERIITAGVYRVATIKAAEMSKLVENAQRDVNIAFVNEIALLCQAAGIATDTVLKAAETKWNFLSFKPGLVGGHCVGVASSYLQQLGNIHNQTTSLLPAARKVNNAMSGFLAQDILQWLVQSGKILQQSKVLILGLTFKEACADVRNSKIFEILSKLQQQGVECTVVDPWVIADEVWRDYKVMVYKAIPEKKYDVILVGVAHPEFKHWNLANYKQEIGIIYDIKGIIDADVDKRL